MKSWEPKDEATRNKQETTTTTTTTTTTERSCILDDFVPDVFLWLQRMDVAKLVGCVLLSILWDKKPRDNWPGAGYK